MVYCRFVLYFEGRSRIVALEAMSRVKAFVLDGAKQAATNNSSCIIIIEAFCSFGVVGWRRLCRLSSPNIVVGLSIFRAVLVSYSICAWDGQYV